MGCRCGGKAHSAVSQTTRSPSNIMGDYKYLKPHQIQARLEIFKRNYCANCESRYQCDYNMYSSCTKRPQ